MLCTIVLMTLAAQAPRQLGPQVAWVYLHAHASATDAGPGRSSAGCDHRRLDAAAVRAVEATGARVRGASCQLIALTVEATDAQVADIGRLAQVRSVGPVGHGSVAPPPGPAVWPREMPTPDLWALDVTGITFAHELGYTGKGVTIGVIDSGFHIAHEVFAGIEVVAARDFIQGDDIVADGPGDPANQDDHGTQVLALLAGDHGDTFRGTAPHARYVLAKTQTLHGDDADEARFVAAVEWMLEQGVDVISTSVGFTADDWPDNLDGTTSAATQIAAIATAQGVAFVAAVGNFGPSPTTLAAPADGANVLAVGAVDEALAVADFSSRGPTIDGRIKPDLVAPGAWLWSIHPGTTSGYVPVFGTSNATPLVAGAAALLVQARVEEAVVFDVPFMLRATASHVEQPNNAHGWGLVDLQAALDWVLTDAPAADEVAGCRLTDAGGGVTLAGLACLLSIRRRVRRIHRQEDKQTKMEPS